VGGIKQPWGQWIAREEPPVNFRVPGSSVREIRLFDPLVGYAVQTFKRIAPKHVISINALILNVVLCIPRCDLWRFSNVATAIHVLSLGSATGQFWNQTEAHQRGPGKAAEGAMDQAAAGIRTTNKHLHEQSGSIRPFFAREQGQSAAPPKLVRWSQFKSNLFGSRKRLTAGEEDKRDRRRLESGRAAPLQNALPDQSAGLRRVVGAF